MHKRGREPSSSAFGRTLYTQVVVGLNPGMNYYMAHSLHLFVTKLLFCSKMTEKEVGDEHKLSIDLGCLFLYPKKPLYIFSWLSDL